MEQQGLSERELRAWRAFFRMQEVLRLRIEQQLQASSGLSNPDYTVLVVLSEAPGGRLRPYELSHKLGWDKSRLHHQLTRMCKRRLINREGSASRAVHVVITSEGRTALQEAAPGHAQEVRRLFIDRLTPAQVDQLAEISAAVLDNPQEDRRMDQRSP